MTKITHHITNQDELRECWARMTALPLDGSHRITIERIPNTRTARQNRSLHRFCEMLGDELNGGGYTVQMVLSQAVEREWDKETVKSQLWKPIQKALTGKASTADADRVEYSQVYEVLNRFMAEKFGVHVPWPQQENK